MPHPSLLVPPRPVARRRARAAGVVALSVVTAIACRRGRDEANDARARQQREVDSLAEAAGRLASGDDAGARTARSDTGMRFTIGDGSAAGITRTSDPALGPGDVRITSSDGMLVLALIGDTVRSRLGDSAVAKVRREVGAAADTTSGFGGFVARTVKGAVAGAMTEAARFTFRIPVAEVHDMRYEDGELHISSGKKNNLSAKFGRPDAERFMDAVRARQAQPAGR